MKDRREELEKRREELVRRMSELSPWIQGSVVVVKRVCGVLVIVGGAWLIYSAQS